MIALVDYGVGNLRSVEKALEAVGAKVYMTADPDRILAADKVVLPGVGAFGDGITELRARNLIAPLKILATSQVPMLGICLGMQLLFETSDELGNHAGLALLPGHESGTFAYFNHSYYCHPTNPQDILASTEYGIRYASVVERGRLYGVQFHPEKSQQVGLTILRNFVEDC